MWCCKDKGRLEWRSAWFWPLHDFSRLIPAGRRSLVCESNLLTQLGSGILKRDKLSIAGLIIGIHIFLSQLEIDSNCPNNFRGIAGCFDRFKFPFESRGYGNRTQ